ncbi:MAG: hypothetical protein AB7F89_07940, partial [Pirellulaceae bacterium]
GERARQALQELYLQQARTMNIPLSDADRSQSSPVPLLVALVRETAARLSGSFPNDPEAAELGRLTYDITAAEYVAANDLQLAALIERIWLRTLALEAARRDEARAAAARGIVAELTELDRHSRHVLIQLRDGEAALLRMWLLIAR